MTNTPSAHPDLPLTYLMRPPLAPPTAGERAPLLVMAHGVRSNERDLFGLAPEMDPRLHIISLRAPLTMEPDAYGWFNVTFAPDGFEIDVEELDASRKVFAETLRAATNAFEVDPARVYLMGFSQGAIISLVTALTAPELLAGVVALSGRIPPEALAWAVAPERTEGLPIFQAHGVADTVIGIDNARAAREVLQRQRVALSYHEYPMPHTITDRTIADLTTWLDLQLDAPRWEPFAGA